MKELQGKLKPSRYLSVLFDEVAAIRSSRDANERQFRCMVALSLSVFVFALGLPTVWSWFATVFPTLAILLSWIWSLNEKSSREAEDRAMALFLAVEQDVEEDYPSIQDEEVASYLHIRARSRSSATNFERRLYVAVGITEVVFVLVDWLAFGYRLTSSISGPV